MSSPINYYDLALFIADELMKMAANMGQKNDHVEDFLSDIKDIAVTFGFSHEAARKSVAEARLIVVRRQRAEMMKQKIMLVRLNYEDKILEERLESLR